MIVVFWRRVYFDLNGGVEGMQAHFEEFEPNQMGEALKKTEDLRKMRAAGEPITHVCIQSEHPDSVGQAGAADPGEEYSWYKRRQDPSIPTGRS